MWAIDHALLSSPGLQRTKDLPWETVGHHLKKQCSAVVRSGETIAHKTHMQKFPQVQMFTQKFTCSNLFCGSYFRVLVVGHKNRENLDLVKISRYTVYTYCNWSTTGCGKASHVHIYQVSCMYWDSVCMVSSGQWALILRCRILIILVCPATKVFHGWSTLQYITHNNFPLCSM